MKKSKSIELILITAALATACQQKEKDWEGSTNKTFIRADTTAPYNRARYHGGGGAGYYAFRPYGNYYNGNYIKSGYYSSAIHEAANIGSNSFKGSVIRGGFGEGAFSAGS